MLYIITLLLLLISNISYAQNSQKTPDMLPITYHVTVVGTTAVVVQAAPTVTSSGFTPIRYSMRFQVISNSTGLLFCTFDGTTPVAYSVGWIYPESGFGGEEFAAYETSYVPQGPLTCVSSVAGASVYYGEAVK